MSSHPYYPPTIQLDGYQPNTYSFFTLIGAWIIFFSIITLTTHYLLSTQKTLSHGEQWTAVWFAICGFIHLFFEGHFSLHHRTLSARTDFLSQEWKEYSLADSRYLFSDPFVVAMESVTAFLWGPLSFYIVWMIFTRHPSRHVCIALVSLGQMYGNVLYYGTAIMEGLETCRWEKMYLWVYFVGLNAVWLVVPAGEFFLQRGGEEC
ncbi:EBP domain-containing protein [Trichophaea hybrida]|nr:EBP domain-containing protein [Trichophaea hybrida]